MSINNSIPEQESLDLKIIFSKITRHWKYFAICIPLCLSISYLIIRYTNPKYKLKTTVLVRDENNVSLGAENLLEGLELFKGKKNIENEIGLIKSHSLIRKALDQLDFNVSYFSKGEIRTIEHYKRFPFFVELDTTHIQITDAPIFIKNIDKNKFEFYINVKSAKALFLNRPNDDKLTIDHFELKGQGYYGEPIENEYFKFKLFPHAKLDQLYKKEFINKDLFFKINNPELMADEYEQELDVANINKKASILELSISGEVINKEKAFLNKLAEVYIESGLEEKNQIAINTIRFIDSQLSGITDSLKTAEEDLQAFRSKNNVLDINLSTKTIIEQVNKLENEKAVLNLKAKYYNYLRDYLLSNQDIKDIIAPSAMGIEDPLLNNQISEVAKLNNEIAALMYSSTEKNPYLISVQKKIKSAKEILIENLNNIVRTTDISLNDINDRIKIVERDISKLPATERKLINIKRRFDLSDNIYNYLLEKRAEAGIAKAANTADNRVIDSANLVYKTPIYPKVSFFFIGALLLGIAIPFAIIIIKDYLLDTVESRKDLEKLTSIPVLGLIGHINDKENRILVTENHYSNISESFRAVRTNLQFLGSDLSTKVIGITSSISGEGKTFFSVNLAVIMSLTNKKVLLITADLRKPTISRYFEFDSSKGLTSYLINQSPIEEIIRKTSFPNLDVINSGPIPPNPAELLTLNKMEELISRVKEKYDYIIIDSSPIGLVADYYSLLNFIDINLYLVRLNYTSREMVKKLEKMNNKENFKNFSIILNDVTFEGGYGYSGYRYGYGSQTGQEKNVFKFRNVFRINK
jgi:tyrosine-protein kinase Etk/Wzc